ncbi:MAG: hypothetical protein KKD31_11165 [Bacteroidetes bacterium]|nr:hypothetical protein [Bacteroidota bacterium]
MLTTILFSSSLFSAELPGTPPPDDPKEYNPRRSVRWNFRNGVNFFQQEQYEQAFSIFREIAKFHPDHANNSFYAGMCAMKIPDKISEAAPYFEKSIRKIAKKHRSRFGRSESPSHAFYYYGIVLEGLKDYRKAQEMFERFQTFVPEEMVNIRKDIQDHIRICQDELVRMGSLTHEDSTFLLADFYRKRLIPLDFQKVNTKYADFGAHLCRNGMIFFSSAKPDPNAPSYIPLGQHTSNVYSVDQVNKVWTSPQMSDIFSSVANEKFCCVSWDDNYVLLVSDMRGNENLYQSVKVDGKWSRPEKVNFNTRKDESFACLSPDGNTMYFCSNRKGGFGGLDIYKVQRIEGKKWGKPENVGGLLNTALDENSPFITEDGKIMFFSSRGHESTGGYDVLCSRLGADSTWGKPVNLGAAVNTAFDELYYKVFGDIVLYSSNRRGGSGGFDIYMAENIDIPRIAVPDSSLIVIKGTLVNPDSVPVNATLQFVNKQTNEIIAETETNPSGIFSICLVKGIEYALQIVEGDSAYRNDNFKAIPDDVAENNVLLYDHTSFVPVKLDHAIIATLDTTPITDNYIVLKGQVLNENNQPVKAFVEFYAKSTGALIAAIPTDENGKYEVTLTDDKQYGVKISAEDYLFWSENFDIADATSTGKTLITVLNNKEFVVTSLASIPKDTSLAVMTDTSTVVVIKPDTLKTDTAAVVVVKPDTLKTDTAAVVVVKPDTLKTDTAAVVVVKPDTLKTDTAAVVVIKPDTLKTDTATAVVIKPDTVKADTTHAVAMVDTLPLKPGEVMVIQVGAGRKMTAQYFGPLGVVWRYTVSDGITRFYAGEYASVAEATPELIRIKALGFDDAWISRIDKSKLSIDKVIVEPMPYTVQLGAGKMRFNYFMKMTDVEMCDGNDGMRRFISGTYASLYDAKKIRDKAVSEGYSDAWIPLVDDNRSGCNPLEQTAYLTPEILPNDITSELVDQTSAIIPRQLVAVAGEQNFRLPQPEKMNSRFLQTLYPVHPNLSSLLQNPKIAGNFEHKPVAGI